MNIDIKEVEKFSSYAQQWWDPKGPFAPLHALNPPRLQFIQQHTELKNKQVLDVGCGAGILTESLYAQQAQVTGIDASAKVLEVAMERAHVNSLTINYVNASAESFLQQNPKQKFDIITCMELIEHVPDPAQLMQTCAQLLKPNGKLFLSTINRTTKAYLLAIIGAEYVLRLLPKNTHEYKKFIKPAELQQFMSDAGLRLTALSGMNYQPFTKRAELCTDSSINYLAYAVREDDGNFI